MKKKYSTREAAEKLRLTHAALSRYISDKKIPAPKMLQVGKFRLHMWTDAQIERVRKILPKIANGRKTRYQKERAKKKGPKKASNMQ